MYPRVFKNDKNMNNKQGYCGYYNNNYLRSSYEYVYCKILEKNNIQYKVEEIRYKINGKNYIPDFHVYKNDKLIEIVEIKSDNKIEIEKALNKILELKKIVKVPINLFLYKDLKKLCELNNLSINKLIKEWKVLADGVNIRKGELNPLFNVKMSDETKKLISTKAKEKCLNPEYVKSITKGLIEFRKNGGIGYRPQFKFAEIECICPVCNNKFIKRENKKKIYCSDKCKLKIITEKANIKTQIRYINLHDCIKQDVINYFNCNLDVFNSCGRMELYKYFRKILIPYNLKDHRVVKFAFCKTHNNIEFLELKNIIQGHLKYMPNLHDEKM